MSALDSLLAEATLVDLTQPLGPATPPWPGQAPLSATAELTHERDGAYTRRLELAEHTGTHLDAPAHFVADGARIHEIPLETLVRPVAVLDVSAAVGDDPAAGVDAEALLAAERPDGLLPKRCVALVRTGWDRFADDPARYTGEADAVSFPGLTDDAAALLLERGVVGIGIDTLSTDLGSSTTYPVHRRVLPAGVWQLEGLVGLDRVPARGAWIVVAPLRLVDGSGSPARVLAIVPPRPA